MTNETTKTNPRKKVTLLIVCILVVLVLVGAAVYCCNRMAPTVTFSRNTISHTDADAKAESKIELITFSVGSSEFMDKISPVSKNINRNINEYAAWFHEVEAEINQTYTAPAEIKASAAINDGRTTFRYEGFVTDRDGNRVLYSRERTFSFVYDEENSIFEHSFKK